MTVGATARRLRVAVLDYEMSNLRSAGKALERLGADVHIAKTPGEIGTVDAIVLPGDGHFGEAMTRLRATGLNQAILDAAGRGIPVLGICIGLQVLFDASEEAPGVPGLGLLSGRVRLLETTGRIPHIGWAPVRWAETSPLAPTDPDDHSTYYFLHSYVVVPDDPASNWGTADHGASFCAVAGSGNVMGFQFHPEKSSREGLALLGRWVAHVAQEVAA